jgi:hypothetical protein
MRNIDFVQASLAALRPDTPNWYGWATHDANGNKIPNDQRMCWEHAIVIQDGVTKPTKAEFDAKLIEVQAEHALQTIERNRRAAYITEADPLFFKAQRGEATMEEWQEKVAEIKQRFPKE